MKHEDLFLIEDTVKCFDCGKLILRTKALFTTHRVICLNCQKNYKVVKDEKIGKYIFIKK